MSLHSTTSVIVSRGKLFQANSIVEKPLHQEQFVSRYVIQSYDSNFSCVDLDQVHDALVLQNAVFTIPLVLAKVCAGYVDHHV